MHVESKSSYSVGVYLFVNLTFKRLTCGFSPIMVLRADVMNLRSPSVGSGHIQRTYFSFIANFVLRKISFSDIFLSNLVATNQQRQHAI